ncbi:MAG: pantoate--beta-alanine ligase [Gammaproteobacteria bacterium]|nr:pantoate--beta-alanine ligase [Gammaproteobacteria bacterium]
MDVCTTAADLKRRISDLRVRRRVAFVPTMGNLHTGHLRLMERARDHADIVIASIYVNPLQFGPGEDFAAYPRTPAADLALLRNAGVDLLFLPSDAEVYPRGQSAQTFVEVPGLSDILCGAFRPGHFRGVTTVVNRLLHLVAPETALFGKKDYQQWLLIRLMVGDLGMPVEIVGVETERAADGLALSSRNGYLTESERRVAPLLFATLRALKDQAEQVGADLPQAETRAIAALATHGFRPDYLSIRRRADLAPPAPGDRELVALAAAWLGRARLLDNVELNLPGSD